MGRGFGLGASVPQDAIRVIAKAAEDAGYSSFWVTDTLKDDGLLTLQTAASVTSRIKLGVGVIPVTRRPAEMIVRNVTERDLPQDRLIMGIGSDAKKGAAKELRDAVVYLKDALDCPVIVAALGPMMLDVAGSVSDGVLLNWLTPPYAAKQGEKVAEAAKAAGRDTPNIMSYVRSGILPENEHRFREEAHKYAIRDTYSKHFERQGVEPWKTCVGGTTKQEFEAGIRPYEAVLDEAIVRSITTEETAEKILEILSICAPDMVNTYGEK